MISALSDLLALRSLANTFASIAHIRNAMATPIKTMLIMDPPSIGRSGLSRRARKNCAPTRVTTHRLLRLLSSNLTVGATFLRNPPQTGIVLWHFER